MSSDIIEIETHRNHYHFNSQGNVNCLTDKFIRKFNVGQDNRTMLLKSYSETLILSIMSNLFEINKLFLNRKAPHSVSWSKHQGISCPKEHF